MPYTLPPLPFPSDALEPYIDKTTMEIHHGKHHNAYVTNLNKAISESAPQLDGKPLHEILANNLAIVPEKIKTAVRNNGGGHHNHSLFWEILNPAAKQSAPIGNLSQAINKTFGGFDKFKEQFKAASRHSGGCNYVFMDGHVKWYRPDQVKCTDTECWWSEEDLSHR